MNVKTSFGGGEPARERTISDGFGQMKLNTARKIDKNAW